MRDSREQVVRRQPNGTGGHPDRRKPEHRHSQGPLSSIRAAIKRTSTRSTSLSESSRDRERDQDRDRDRRRPEITILSAEPLASTSWFSGASGGFPPPPPPPSQIWGPSIPPSLQAPPSYEEVIREKTQEQVLLPSSSSCSSSSSHPASTITIATQTETPSFPDSRDSRVRRPVRPPRPRLSITTSQSALTSLCSVVPEAVPHAAAQTCDLTELCSPLTSTSAAQTDQWDPSSAAVNVGDPPTEPRPRPRPRSRLSVQPISSEVKVQTLVKLREDGLATLAARAGNDSSNQEVSQGKYLQELLEAFSADDWGFPERHSDSSGHSQSESEEGDEEEDKEDKEDMVTLKVRMQALEQQEQDADSSCRDTNRPEPRPRPRLQGQPPKSAPPTVAPKPKNLSHVPKPSTKQFWEDGAMKTDSASPPETLQSKTPPSAPVPAPRPPPPKLTPSVSETSLANPKPPPRPQVSPRAGVGASHQERSPAARQTVLTPPPSGGTRTETGDETLDTANQAVKTGSGRPDVPTKPAALTSSSPRRASAPNLLPKPSGASPSSPDPKLVPPEPSGPVPGLKPPGSAPQPSGPVPVLKPPGSGPSPALRKRPVIQTKPETSCSSDPRPPRPSNVKLLPLRPPPIKSTPGRPPPPANQLAPPPSKAGPAPSVSPASQSSPSQTTLSVSANQVPSQRAAKRGPPLPPRPKPGHPLYSSYMKQEVLIVLDHPSPSENQSGEGRNQTAVGPFINPSQSLLDLDLQPEPAPHQDSLSKSTLEGLGQSESQSILPLQPPEQKEPPDPPVSGPRCLALFDYEGQDDDELTFSQGDVITLLELAEQEWGRGQTEQEWGRGQIHGRMGIFPLNFTKVVEALPQPTPSNTSSTDTSSTNTSSTNTSSTEGPETKTQDQDSDSEAEEWVVALFDFPGQTEEDLPFHKGALIQVTEHIDVEWRRGRVGGREGIYPAAFTQSCSAQPIPGQQSAVKGVAKFDFTAESEDELTLKVGDIITEVESVDEQWIVGVVGGKRGIAPKNYISLL